MKKTVKITAFILALATLVCLSSCKLTSIDKMLAEGGNNAQFQSEPQSVSQQPYLTTFPSSTAPYDITTTLPQIIEPTSVPSASEVPATQPVVTQPAVTDYSSYTPAQIIDLYSTALNKTRAFGGQLTVHHKEAFNADVLEASPGGALTTKLANFVISSVVDPSESDYKFSGGKAVNEDGETIPILLPQRNNFSLSPASVQSATVQNNGGTLHVMIKLVPEKVGFGEVPPINAGAVGYLDTSKLSFSVVTINSCEINYSGSVIDAYILPEGYIGSVTYIINMTTVGSVSGLGITGSGTIEGAQTETWELKW